MAKGLRGFLDRMHPLFAKGGKFEKYYVLYEMVDTIFYSPGDVTRGAPHVRDGIDLKRTMIYVWLATFPAILMGAWNVGFQANVALASMGAEGIDSWRAMFIAPFGYDASNHLANVVHGLTYWIPIYFVTFLVGGLWEVLFAGVRNHEVNEGFFVTSILFSLILAPTTPLWQVALGISFGVVIGKEIFGGTGKNFLNPALVGRAFLYFAYPAQQSGDQVWVAADGYTQASALSMAAEGGVSSITDGGITWMQTFIGSVPGSVGEVSTIAILIGGAFLMYTGIANYRITLGMFAGMIGTVLLFNLIGGEGEPYFDVPWYWHFTMGGFAFGAVFMATDPVSSSHTNAGRWIFGALCGFMTVLIRVVNPAFPEGVMLAILFANIFAPLIDYFVMRANMRRREARTLTAA
ncbi:MAG: NADH:ubiquinone reductase (Na(+)-transporting) subunit B [Algiphilus sp.]|uniref:NADH:ubiquinone reductase (Na(+)-transporting) subunit B n=1 Tax=Algiphilus sp. TaxID=1872431 RepID=UPI0025C38AD6|nr:NADH:ubiquinone reductase (Na(+)-transporting) subunit B [Algiphilus sp.]MCI5102917.1 NADH:ubiquinone reductase (Na(+)-transporting) subunit B [Algiphilus sp.]